MPKILITGSSGNVGRATVEWLLRLDKKQTFRLGLRRPDKASQEYGEEKRLERVTFDFTDPSTHQAALRNIEYVFLLRPPKLANVDKQFLPFLEEAQKSGIKGMVFLSVQGAEKISNLPHARIEKLIRKLELPFVFLRAGYFMQNLTTTLYADIKANGEVTLPAGRAKFSWVDVDNLGEVAARTLLEFDGYQNQAFTLTGPQNLNFSDAIAVINQTLSTDLKYRPTNVFSYWYHLRKQKLSWIQIFILTLIHLTPRFAPSPPPTRKYTEITGKDPTTLAEFAKREENKFSR